MGRHSSGKNNYSLSAGAIIALVVAIALIIAGIWWYVSHRESPADPASNATGRDCTLVPVAATDRQLAETLIASWSDPAGDECVEAEYTEDIDNAAIFIGPDSPLVDEELSASGRNADGDKQPVASVPVGVSGSERVTISDIDPTSVTYDTDTQPEASVLVADALGAEDLDTEGGQYSATAETQAPEGQAFTPVDGVQLVHFARTLAPNDTVSEEQAAAATTLTDSAVELYDGPDASPEAPDQLWAAATSTDQGTDGEREEDGQAGSEKSQPEPVKEGTQLADHTLFLLDTSTAIAPFYEQSASAIGDAAVAATGQGAQVALWNYSSPLNPGVAQGWRRNINFTDAGEEVRQSVQRFGTGGQPQTRSAVEAALASTAELDGTGRVVLVTTGTADSLRALPPLPDNVELSVIHVGAGAVDEELTELATDNVHVVDPAALGDVVRNATGV